MIDMAITSAIVYLVTSNLFKSLMSVHKNVDKFALSFEEYAQQ